MRNSLKEAVCSLFSVVEGNGVLYESSMCYCLKGGTLSLVAEIPRYIPSVFSGSMDAELPSAIQYTVTPTLSPFALISYCR